MHIGFTFIMCSSYNFVFAGWHFNQALIIEVPTFKRIRLLGWLRVVKISLIWGYRANYS